MRSLLKPAKAALLALLVFSTLINLLMLASPLYMLQVFDRVLSSESLDTLIWLSLLVLGALVTLSFVDYIRHQIANNIGIWVGEHYTLQLMRAGLLEAAARNSSNRVGQVVRDIGTVRQFIASPSFLALYDLPLAPMFIIVVFLLHPILGALALGSSLVVFLLTWLEERLSSEHVATTNFQLGKVYGDAERASRSANAVVAMGFTSRYSNTWHANYARLMKGQIALSQLSARISSLTRFIRLVMQIAAMGLGAYLVIQSEITPGAMIAGSILITRAVAPIEQGIAAWRGYLGYRQAKKRLSKASDLFEERSRKVSRPRPKTGLSVENLSYAPPKAQEFMLKGISFSLQAGESIGVVGSTGAGKTTLARLLLGLQTPSTGFVRLDGTDLSTWDSDDLGQYIGYVPQSTQLLNGTVKDNIGRFSKSDLESVIAAAELVGVHQHILKLPQGYDTSIQDAETQLSGGELQRIALARALYGSPALVVMDEPNANLDPQGETALIRAVQKIKETGCSVVMISHRANLLRSMDKVLMLQGGTAEIIQQRAPDTLSSEYGYLSQVVEANSSPNTDKVRRLKGAQ